MATSLGAAISTTSENYITVASASGITAGSTIIRVDAEDMQVLGVEGLILKVMRGVAGTKAATHANAAVVETGVPTATALKIPVVEIIGSSFTATTASTAAKGYIAVLIDGTLRYIPVTDAY
jgi:hypothetical protein